MGAPIKHNYCDRDLLHKELMEFKKTGVCSNELANLFYKVCKGYGELVKTHDKDDRTQMAIEYLLLYSHNYNPSKGSPFSYITQIIKNAYKRHYNINKRDYDRYGFNLQEIYSI